MNELLIRNGYVFDPINGIDGELMDIAIRDGKVVESVDPRGAKVVDASRRTVMPGGVDIHSHIAGSKVNLGRALRPEDHYKDVEPKTSVTRSGVGRTVPSTFTTGYRYARMGYTTVIEPATPPIKTRHTHEELDDIPMLDKACFPLFGNNWMVMEYVRDDNVEECAAFIAWMQNALKGYAVKIVNPGGGVAWGWGRNVTDLDGEVPDFDVTPREIVRTLVKANQILNLPHAVHLHVNRLGVPGNYAVTLETMKAVEDLAKGERPILHVTHCQFCAFTGKSYATMRSGAEAVAKYVNDHKHVSIDIGQVIFGRTTTMTADGPFEYYLQYLEGAKWMNADVEIECAAGIVPVRYRRRSYVNATQWSIGLELALLVEDPWRALFTTDHPNGGRFTSYPRLISWLISKGAREKVLRKLNKRAARRSLIPAIDREYTLSEIAIVTRAGTARSLGLKSKGHLGVGADADVSIYDVDPTKIDPSKDYKRVRKAFRRAAYTIKDGQIVVKDGEVVREAVGKTFWTRVKVSEDLMEKVSRDVKDYFERWYTMRFENYPIPEGFLAESRPIEIEAEV